ncbi:MAG: hypothetical protein OCD03_08050 [Hyphomicrobiales bacterium]
MLHFGKNLNTLQKRFKRVPLAVLFLLIIQSFLPLTASANIRNLYQSSSLENVIIICAGTELVYMRLTKNGGYTKIPAPDNIPKSVQTQHCDGCILPGSALPSADNQPYYISLIQAAKCADIDILPAKAHRHQRPPSRAPPA